jgi:UDP-glucose 6-dehydrogenase
MNMNMNKHPHHREKGIEKIRQQFRETTPITQPQLEEMVQNRRLRGIKEEVIQQFIDSIMVDQSRFIYFMVYAPADEEGQTRLTILKETAMSVAEAVTRLDNYGKFIEQDDHTSMPRLHKWR